MSKILFTGDRNYCRLYEQYVSRIVRQISLINLDEAKRSSSPKLLEVIVGDCPTGVDNLVRGCCRKKQVKCTVFKAYWDKHHLSAGPIRNKEMVDQEPALCIAVHNDYPHSKGTKNCASLAMGAGITTALVPRDAEFDLTDYDLV